MSGPDWLPGDADDGTAPSLDQWMRRQLLDRRVVLVTGELDDRAANEVGASLMTLDATGDQPVTMRIDSNGGSIGAALALIDVIDLLGVPVDAWCSGQAVGPPVGVFAACRQRTMAPHARLGLFEPTMEAHGDASRIQLLAAAHHDQWKAFCGRLAQLSGHSVQRILDDAGRGLFLTGTEAVAYGLADEVADASTRLAPLPHRQVGFGN